MGEKYINNREEGGTFEDFCESASYHIALTALSKAWDSISDEELKHMQYAFENTLLDGNISEDAMALAYVFFFFWFTV